MNIKNKLVSVLGAAVLAAGLGAPALLHAQQTSTANIDVEIGVAEDGGTLSFNFQQNVAFPDVAFSNTNRVVNGGMTLSVQDTRGQSQGWQFSIKATNFTSEESADIIPVENLSLDTGTVTVISGRALPLPVATDLPAASTGEHVLFAAAKESGNGRYSVPVTGTVVIPGGTNIGTYTSVLTGNLVTAP